MGFWKNTLSLGGIAVAGLVGVMTLTNPDNGSYEEYATQQLTVYLEENVCTELPSILGDLLSNQCGDLLRKNQTQINKLIKDGTTASNFVLFSVFHTRLEIPDMDAAPSYEFKTIGIFRQFFTYKAEET
ncbi:MAG: DUF4359 domain-containing protein [Leptolyngbyaceae cyanobacterium MO_188.B28]|nr:DUF4359 domain-containing protein [Leptolyngbyaceae cyanobacterium MO_188.B28]